MIREGGESSKLQLPEPIDMHQPHLNSQDERRAFVEGNEAMKNVLRVIQRDYQRQLINLINPVLKAKLDIAVRSPETNWNALPSRYITLIVPRYQGSEAPIRRYSPENVIVDLHSLVDNAEIDWKSLQKLADSFEGLTTKEFSSRARSLLGYKGDYKFRVR